MPSYYYITYQQLRPAIHGLFMENVIVAVSAPILRGLTPATVSG